MLFYSQALFKKLSVLCETETRHAVQDLSDHSHSLWGIKTVQCIWIYSSVKTDQGWCLGEVREADGPRGL